MVLLSLRRFSDVVNHGVAGYNGPLIEAGDYHHDETGSRRPE